MIRILSEHSVEMVGITSTTESTDGDARDTSELSRKSEQLGGFVRLTFQ